MARSKRSSDGLPRRAFLKQGVALLGAGGLGAASVAGAEAAGPPDSPPWMKSPGAGMSEYGSPARHEAHVKRAAIASRPGTTGSGASRTPLEALDGMITPSGLHFERHHSGVPDIDPSQHRLLIHGMVRRPLLFTVEALMRYPRVSRIHFLECSGNSGVMYNPSPPNLTAGQTHGLVSCSEWTGVPLRLLLEEAGADPNAPLMFTYPMEVKSLITRPSLGIGLSGPGLYEISGIAWSGNGSIARVEVSTDGGKTWGAAARATPVLPRAITLFRMPWKWDGRPTVLKSRATDDTGAVQPERDRFISH